MPRLSIITITKGDPKGFANTKASLDAQGYTDYEWIVVDGDKEPDNGIYDAMNKGLARASGGYLIFMNGGDTFATPNVLERIAEALVDEPDFVYGDSYEHGHLKPARHNINSGMITHHQSMVYRATTRRYDERYTIAADYKFTIQALQAAKKTKYLPIPICIFADGGLSQRRVDIARAESEAIRKEMGIKAPLVSNFQYAASMLKKISPSIYWALRSRMRTSRL